MKTSFNIDTKWLDHHFCDVFCLNLGDLYMESIIYFLL